MDIAIITGADTPLGLQIVQHLIQQGCRVHGIGNNFAQVNWSDPHFMAHAIDLTDLAAVHSTAASILEAEQRVDILIHALDITPGTDFEKLPLGNLEAILKVGLLGPVLLTRAVLPNLLRFRGQLIHLIPANKSGHAASAANALILGGLREMNQALFDQGRDQGLRLTNLILRQNEALPGAKVSDAQLAQSRIDPKAVLRTLEALLSPHATNVPSEVTLYPQLSPDAGEALPETPLALDPYNQVVLPPQAYCPPEPEPIATKAADRIERVIPYSDDEMEERIAAAIEDFEAHPERYEANHSRDGKSTGSSKTRRKRGGRGRTKSRGEPVASQPDNVSSEATGKTPPEPAAQSEKAAKRRQQRASTKGRRKTKAAASSDLTTANPSEATAQTEAAAPKKAAPKATPKTTATKKAVKKAAVKKVARKSAAASKARTTKTKAASSQTAAKKSATKKTARKRAKKVAKGDDA
jgi:hypothetical protein